ncbi:MAG: ArsR family transcriptional regulator, partial [Vicinamibacterales bacterium]
AGVRSMFEAWLGTAYDFDALSVVLATAAAERLDGDPVWLMVLSGSGNGKTETVQPLSGAGAVVTSTITSEGALLSGTSAREKGKDATGGLLRRLGPSGVLVIKDVTSILSMNRDARSMVLAALREIHDGKWERNIGTDGGRTLTWTGRISVIGACTTAWDRAHEVIASMGDRFVVVRMKSGTRLDVGRQALLNTGQESLMRQKLADVVAALLTTVDPTEAIHPKPEEVDRLLRAANLVTLCRTAVDYDYKGGVIDAHEPEAPTRFGKQLLQIMRGACAIGLSRVEALALAIRCARDSMPPLRLQILEDVAAHPHSRTGDVRRRIDKPYTTVDRQLQALHMLGVLTVDEVAVAGGKTSWLYAVAEDIDVAAVASPEMSGGGAQPVAEAPYFNSSTTCSDKSGDGEVARERF